MAGQSASRANLTTAQIIASFKEIVKDPTKLDEATNYLYDSLLDDAIVGVILEVHQLMKTGNLEALDGIAESDFEPPAYQMVDVPEFDIFGLPTAQKPMDCDCPNCGRVVNVSRFAPHLEKCMGMGRTRGIRRSAAMAAAPSATVTSSSEITSTSMGDSNNCAATSSNGAGGIEGAVGGDMDMEWSGETSEKRRKKNSQDELENFENLENMT